MQQVRAVWQGERRFDTGRPDGPTARFDGEAQTGQSPVDALLSAVAVCSGIDVVDIIAKRRAPVTRMSVEVTAERRTEHPKRVTKLELHFMIDGEGIEYAHAERAIQLSFERYCSVAASLGSDIVVDTRLTLNGESHEAVRQHVWDPRAQPA